MNVIAQRIQPAFVLAISLVLSGISISAHTQTHESRTVTVVRGTVRDGQGGAVRGATVLVRSHPTTPARMVETGWDGRFQTDPLASGTCEIEVRAHGFASQSQVVTVPSDRAIEFVVQPAPVIEDVRVVSGARQDELRQTLNTRVDVVTRTRIDESGADTVAEILREIPGVVTRRGSEGAGAGGEQIQGLDSRQVLVLLDGLPLVGARGIKRGVLNLDRQSTGPLERIEVVKGAASALYGSDAMGGVINLITRQSAAPVSAGVSLAGGSRGDVDVSTETGLRRGPWSGLFMVERHQLDGFDLTPSTFDTTGASSRRTDGFGKLGWRPTSSLGVTGLVTGYHNRTTGRSNGELGPQEDDIRESTVNSSVTATWQAAPTTNLELRVHQARFDEDSTGALAPPRSTPLEPGALDERLTRVETSGSQVVGTRHHLQGGLEYAHDQYAGINRLRDETGEEVWNGTAWAQHRLSLGLATTTVGLRVDRHSIFGAAVSPKIAVNARARENVSVRASYGRGFRAPDVGQLYYRFLNPTNFYQVVGNPSLRPEYANSLQLGTDVVVADRRARFGINLFRNDVRDLIDSVSLGFVATPEQLQATIDREGLDPSFRPVLGRLLLTYRNVADAVTQGVELDGEVALTLNVSLAAAYTYLDAKDDQTDLALTGRHRHQGHVRATWGLERIGLRANLRGTFFSSWVAARATANGVVTDTVAPRFALWDAFLSQRVVRGLVAFAAVDNLADSQDPNTGILSPTGTAAAIYRPEAGRTARVGLKWSWAR